MHIKNTLGRAAGIAVIVAICWLSLAGMASASTAQRAAVTPGSHRTAPVSRAINAPIPGCAFQTSNGHYLTAVSGGGRTTEVIHTDATSIGSWEKFTLIDSGDGSPNIHYGFQTFHGFYLTAVNGGGSTTNVMYSNATQIGAWEKLSLDSLGNGAYAIETINGHFLTAVGGGGQVNNTIHSDATQIGAWETFQVTCGH